MRHVSWAIFIALAVVLVIPASPALAVSEVDQPGCRWSHVYGSSSTTWVSYQWGDRLQSAGTWWRTAFEASISDWNGTPTRMRLYEESYGAIYLNTYYADDNLSGYAQPYCSGSTTYAYDVLANSENTHYTANVRRSVTGHELGHGLSLGHISDSGIALLGNNPDPNLYYTPRQLDIDLVNQVYW